MFLGQWSFTGTALPFDGEVHEFDEDIVILFTSDDDISKDGWKLSFKSEGTLIIRPLAKPWPYLPSYEYVGSPLTLQNFKSSLQLLYHTSSTYNRDILHHPWTS